MGSREIAPYLLPFDKDSSSPSAEKPSSQEIGIYNETDRLRAAVLWGPVGAEAVLAQLYPETESLFHEEMNVPLAREEAQTLAVELEGLGVEIVLARDRLADILPDSSYTAEEMESALLTKARETFSIYHLGDLSNLEAQVVELLQADIDRYGEQGAVNLNDALCLEPEIPMGNTIYARDQMNVLLGRRICSRMKKDIRIPEVRHYNSVYAEILQGDNPITIPERETFEGGDAYIHDNIVYVGVGTRTSFGAAEHIYEQLREEIEAHGMGFAIVKDVHLDQRNFRQQQDSMHLDTFSNPIGEKQIAICKEETDSRRVIFLETNSDGETVPIDTGQTFTEHLEARGNELAIIPQEEQKGFGCNFLTLDEKTIVFPREDNTITRTVLESFGKTVEYIPLDENTKGTGAAHCMTGQLRRQN